MRTIQGAAGDKDHSRIRSVLAHAFSDRALHAQESLIRAHVDRLVQRLQDLHGKPTDIVRWMHHHSYDVIAHLCEMYRRSLPKDTWNQAILSLVYTLPYIYLSKKSCIYESSKENLCT